MDCPSLSDTERLDLFDRAISGQITKEEREVLNACLRCSREYRDAYRALALLHADLPGVVRVSRARQLVYEEIRLRDAGNDLAPRLGDSGDPADGSLRSCGAGTEQLLDDLAGSTVSPERSHAGDARHSFGRRFGSRLSGFLVVAASVAVAVGWYTLSNPSSVHLQEGLRQPAIVAQVVAVEDVASDDLLLRTGVSYREGSRLKFTEGVAKINLPSGTELVLQGPCELGLTAPDRVRLYEGRITARIASWASDFEVETDTLRVINLGTRFSVEADADGSTEVHVSGGQVRVQPFDTLDNTRTSFLLYAGEGVRIDAILNTETRIAAKFDRFVEEFGDFRPFRPIKIFDTGKGLEPGDEDLHWTIVDGAIGEGYQGPQHAVVCDPDISYLPNNPHLSQWVSVSRDLRPGCLPNTPFVFQTEFDLSGYDLSTVVVLADIIADNGVRAVRINGKSVSLTPWRDNLPGQRFHRFRRAEIVEGFVPGKNVIEIDVWNGIYHGKDTPNPMALRVEWQAFGIPLAQPAVSGESI